MSLAFLRDMIQSVGIFYKSRKTKKKFYFLNLEYLKMFLRRLLLFTSPESRLRPQKKPGLDIWPLEKPNPKYRTRSNKD